MTIGILSGILFGLIILMGYIIWGIKSIKDIKSCKDIDYWNVSTVFFVMHTIAIIISAIIILIVEYKDVKLW